MLLQELLPLGSGRLLVLDARNRAALRVGAGADGPREAFVGQPRRPPVEAALPAASSPKDCFSAGRQWIDPIYRTYDRPRGT